jgi:hypothetical protein
MSVECLFSMTLLQGLALHALERYGEAVVALVEAGG